MIDPAYAAAGALVGLLVGLTGVGGGSLMTPLLMLGFGITPAVAVGTDLLFAAGTKLAGTLAHGTGRSVEWRIVALLTAGSLPAALATTLVLHALGAP
ncbi:TSUP family transporter, partial [Acidisphaera rubrifaciens]|uniref:TSUP family transporter n=1 Tax=Acidisphaera rubrifaciens TaxID=50715 RepID=UPI00066212A4